ncbi:MAG: entericidin A/B family lipoprotein [Thermodesulfovibrionales bacterium]|nr:entericidin A/B family lipoprotein [Thermodesulfovibrionales bacterium]
MTRLISYLLLSLILLSMGCNTFHGVGKDVESVGKTIQKSSQ